MTEKQTHTPGPWEVHVAATTRHGYDIQNRDESKLIAYNLKNKANAALIAAAPELLAAARAALAYLDEYRPKGGVMKNFEQYNHHENGAVKPLRAAIAKAEGGE